MYQEASASNYGASAPQTVARQPGLHEHHQQLVARLMNTNQSIETMIQRLTGPRPSGVQEANGLKAQHEPSLMEYAQRANQELMALEDHLKELSGLIG